MQESKIYHVLSIDEAVAKPFTDAYESDSFKTDGFVHCCYSEQLRYVAAKFFTDQKRLVIRRIDPEKLSSELKVEDTGDHGKFPHVYGPINPEACMHEIVWFPPIPR